MENDIEKKYTVSFALAGVSTLTQKNFVEKEEALAFYKRCKDKKLSKVKLLKKKVQKDG